MADLSITLKKLRENMKTIEQIKERIEELEKEISFLVSDAKEDEDRNYIINKKAELKSLKWVLGE